MDKQKLLKQLAAAWEDFQRSYEGLPEPHLQEPGVTGDWSVKDIIAHVTTWEEEALKYLPSLLDGKRPPRYKDLYGGIDAFNARMSDELTALPLADVLKQAAETHRRLVAYVETAPDQEFVQETRFRRRLRLDTYSHYPIHTRAIREWRERRLSTGSE